MDSNRLYPFKSVMQNSGETVAYKLYSICIMHFASQFVSNKEIADILIVRAISCVLPLTADFSSSEFFYINSIP